MNALIVPLLLFTIPDAAPYFTFEIISTYYEQYTNINNDSIRVGVDFDLYIRLDHELGLNDIYNIFDEDIEIRQRYNLELQENYNYNDISFIITDIYFDYIEYIQTYDSATLTINYTLETYASDRNGYDTAFKIIQDSIRIYREIDFNIPYRASFDPLYDSVRLEKDLRGLSYDEIYQDGYDDGYHDGEEEGYLNGYYDGYEEGEYYGSMTQPIFKLFNAVFRVIDNVLSVEILPGIKIWYVLGVPFVFLIIQFFINLWR